MMTTRRLWDDIEFLVEHEAINTLQHLIEVTERIRATTSPRIPPIDAKSQGTVGKVSLRPGDANRSWRIIE